MTGYDPWLDARSRANLKVGISDFIAEQSWWMPSERLILISSALPAGVLRSAALAHQLAHVDLEGSRLVRHVRSGRRDPNDVEVMARSMVAHRFLSIDAMFDEAFSEGVVDSDGLSEVLGVTPVMLADRLRFAEVTEREVAAELHAVIRWARRPAERWSCGQQLSPTQSSGSALRSTHSRQRPSSLISA